MNNERKLKCEVWEDIPLWHKVIKAQIIEDEHFELPSAYIYNLIRNEDGTINFTRLKDHLQILENVDIIVLDLLTPTLADGCETAKFIKEQFPNIKILGTHYGIARIDAGTVQQAMRRGLDGLIQKAWHHAEFARIFSCLRDSILDPGEVDKHTDYAMNPIIRAILNG